MFDCVIRVLRPCCGRGVAMLLFFMTPTLVAMQSSRCSLSLSLSLSLSSSSSSSSFFFFFLLLLLLHLLLLLFLLLLLIGALDRVLIDRSSCSVIHRCFPLCWAVCAAAGGGVQGVLVGGAGRRVEPAQQ